MTSQWPLRAFSLALSRSFSSSSLSSFPLKHVTKSNFDSALAELRSHVRAAVFVAIDLEMTGVTSAPWRDSFEFDRYDIRYLKVKDSAEKFAVVQFGVCPFRWDSHRHSFVAHPYNFFVFPRQELQVDGPSYEFLCQTASMDFLAKFQFDFNSCIREGVSYLSRAQEEEALRRLNVQYEDELLDGWHSLKRVRDMPLVSLTDVLFSERTKNKLSEWRDALLKDRNGRSELQGILNASKQQFQTIFYKMRPALCLKGFTSHQLNLIQLVTKKHFKDLVYVHVNGENSCSEQFVVYADSNGDKNLLMKEVNDEYHRGEERKIKDAIGFRHVIDLLSSEQKLIVGHNCFLDIAHVYSKFLGTLPSTAEEFVSSVNKYFPCIVDTKVLLNANNVLRQRMKKSSTTLSSAFSLLCHQIALVSNTSSNLASSPCVKVEVQVDDNRSSNWNSGVKHEAGYDAFMTGCVFAQACSHLGVDFKLHSSSENLACNENLEKHINHLYLSWIYGEIIDLRTGNRGAEPFGYNNLKKLRKILFENIVLIWRFPSRLEAREIKECISKVFGPASVTSIYHVDATAVFVQFSNVKFVSEFLILKEYLEKSNDAISVLHPLSKLLEGGNTCAAGYETYKEICSSPISKVLFADQAEAIGIRWKTKLVESKVEAQSQEQESLPDDNAANSESASVNESNTGKKHDIDDLVIDKSSRGRSSCDDVIDSFYSAAVNQIRATNL